MQSRRRRRNRPPTRPRAPRPSVTPQTQAVFVLALVFLVGTICLLAMSFWRLRDLPRTATGSGTRVTTTVTTATGGGGQQREIILHLRDLVNGMVWLSSQPGGGLTPTQLQQAQALMPAIRANLQGPPSLVDEKLEGQVKALISAEQLDAMSRWLATQKNPPDFMASLSALEKMAGGSRGVRQ